MNYSPAGMRVWDAWYMPVGDLVHCYHLQQRRPGSAASDAQVNSLGHAVSHDLVHWEERPVAFGPDPASPLDDMQPWTGCALWHEGQGYLYYTMRGSANGGRMQQIGLARTSDPERWERYSQNPVIVPDPHWYADPLRPISGAVDCRDLLVIADQTGQGWLGFYATRIPGEELPETSVIACVRSSDLTQWEHLPPAFAPGRFACLEVPDVFPLNDRWYMTCLTGNFYGNRGYWSDPGIVNGTMYAVSDRPEGPYIELRDNVLIAARTTGPISCRTVAWEGELNVLYTDRERVGGTDAGSMATGTLSTPKVLRTEGDRLWAAYSPRIEKYVAEELITPIQPPDLETQPPWGQLWPLSSARWTTSGGGIIGESRTGWGVARLDAAAESFIFEATILLERGAAAGLALRLSDQLTGSVVMLDAERGLVAYCEAPAFDFEEARLTPVPFGTPLHLRVVNRREHLEIYVNDDLRLAFSRYRGLGGGLGLFVDRARAQFRDIWLRTLDISHEEENYDYSCQPALCRASLRPRL